MGNRESRNLGLALAFLLVAILAFRYLEGQTTTASSVPFDVQDPPKFSLVGQADTAIVTWVNQTGTPLSNVIVYPDSIKTYYSRNMEWVVRLTGIRYRGTGMEMFKLDRQVWSPNGNSQDTLWVRGRNVYTKAPWGNGVDIIIKTGADVGDQFTIYFRTMQPLKVDGNGLLQIRIAKPDSFNTY
jgi:hypothetical protein